MASSWNRVMVILGSTREGRLGERVGKFILAGLKERNLDVDFIDPMETQLPMLEKPLHFHRPAESAPQQLQDLNKKIKESDAIIVVSCEYNHSIPPALANFVDHFPGSSFAGKPSGIVTYSPSFVGGARAGIQLRSLLGELGCISTSNMLTIPKVHNAINADGTPNPESEEGSHMVSALKKFLDQLAWWASAAKNQREQFGMW